MQSINRYIKISSKHNSTLLQILNFCGIKNPQKILNCFTTWTKLSATVFIFLSNKDVKYPKVVICDVLRDLVPFVQFKKREKHPWRSVTLLKLTFLHGCFSRFLNCTNGNKSRNAPHYRV